MTIIDKIIKIHTFFLIEKGTQSFKLYDKVENCDMKACPLVLLDLMSGAHKEK
jgi:hypothetical protein